MGIGETVTTAITSKTYADGVELSLKLYYTYLTIVRTYRFSYLEGNTRQLLIKPLTANTLCTDQKVALEFHASAIRALGAVGGGL